MVQVNSNIGFANFKRFQDTKTLFLDGRHKSLISKLAVWEAVKFNYNVLFETRITPLPQDKIRKIHRDISDAFEGEEEPEWSLLFHFIKNPENFDKSREVRHGSLRDNLFKDSVRLKRILRLEEWRNREDSYLSHVKGIDAASSEIGCRPEIFAHAFRYLKGAGFATTFHVGEDFYDIADGLRAIYEAITFLNLEAGDRIGHALALGIDPYQFYSERHNIIALPVQWMLDNVVWLYYISREFNCLMEPGTEDFLISTFRKLVRRIGYELNTDSSHDNDKGRMDGRYDERRVEMIDYYQSMLLRGDTPDGSGDYTTKPLAYVSNVWASYGQQKSERVNDIRRGNLAARDLYRAYLSNRRIIEAGEKVASFVLPSGYPALIDSIQEKMMRMISKSQIGIECCPSSNFRIGHFKRYDQHPIFRFMPVRSDRTPYPLSVTVNTDDLGVFSTSLPNEFSLLALALMKMKDTDGKHMYSSQEIYDWVERIVKNGNKFSFSDRPSAKIHR